MVIKEISKKIALLLDPQSGLFTGKQSSPTKSTSDILGIGYSTARKYINGEIKPTTYTIGIICKKLNDQKGRFQGLELVEEDFKDSVNIFDFASKLGISKDLCLKSIDKLNCEHAPLLPGFYYHNEAAAESIFNDYKGIYKIYRYGTSKTNNKDVFILIMQVCYVLEILGKFVIRCKLFLPEKKSTSQFEYNGFCCDIDSHLYWVFELGTHARKKDFIFIIANKERELEGPDTIMSKGIYLSINQEPMTMPVQKTVLFEKIMADSSSEKLDESISKEMCILDTEKKIEKGVKPDVKARLESE